MPRFQPFRPVMHIALWSGLAFLLPAGNARAAETTVCLQPLGRHEASLLGPIARGIAQVYGLGVRTLPPRPLPQAAWYAPRNRYRAEQLLDALQPRAPGCDFALAFTALDVSTRLRGHADWGVLGLSYAGKGVSVVSSFRMHREADHARLLQRAVKVSLHEVGHAIGLAHSHEGAACLMNDPGGAIKTIDAAFGTLCAGERAAAESLLQHSLPKPAPLDWAKIEK